MALYGLLKTLLDPVVFGLTILALGLLFLRKEKRFSKPFLITSFLFFYIVSISPVSNGLSYLLEKDYFISNADNAGKLDVIVVLAGGVSDNKYLKEKTLSWQTASRLLHAVQMFKKTGADYLVCSGANAIFIEAEVMGIAAEKIGVMKDKIKLDVKSKNTREHAVELANLFNNQNLRIGLVTSAYHMKRSEAEFRKYFHNIVPLPSDYLYTSPPLSIFTFLPQITNLYKFSIAIKEIIGIGWYKISELLNNDAIKNRKDSTLLQLR